MNSEKDLDEILAQQVAKMNKKYNFDFENDQPLEGKFKWIKDVEKLETTKHEDSVTKPKESKKEVKK
jgi:hypothetical protein